MNQYIKKHFGEIAGWKLNRKFSIIILFIVVLPVIILGVIIFHIMQSNVINEKTAYMQSNMERQEEQIETNISTINLTTQFFLSDTGLLELLNDSEQEQELSVTEVMDFYKQDIAALERLVNNNPSLYQVRVYDKKDTVQEMMPILYRKSRMEKLSWASKEDYYGWNFNYVDNLFESYMINQGKRIMALVSPISNYEDGEIGIIEVAMTMQKMFPSLYERNESEWSCFVTNSGEFYFGDNKQDDSREMMKQIIKEGPTEEKLLTKYTNYNKKKLVISYLKLNELDGMLVNVNDITKDIKDVYRLQQIVILSILVVIIILYFLINEIVNHMLSKFYIILSSIRRVQEGNLDEEIEDCGNDEMGELGRQVNKMLEHIRQLMQDNINREVLVKNSEIRALQNQINAHFIYNVLESIKMMAEIEGQYAISDAITSLGKLLRYSMKWTSGNVTVAAEIDYIKNYLALINLRFDYEIYLSLNLPSEIYNQEIPKMSLQPIVENSIYHGIEQIAENTNIYIKGFYEENDCIIEITDAGKGMTEDEVTSLYKKMHGEVETSGGSGTGIGLKNVQDRIRMSFGNKYGLEISSKLGCFTKVRIRIPRTQQGED